MKIPEEILSNEVDIVSNVILSKDGFGRTRYAVDKGALGNVSGAIYAQCEKVLRENVSSEMRHSDGANAIQSCKNVTIFSKTLLGSNVPDKLKIAMFSELNIMGFMFDRNRKSYVACFEFLGQLLDAVQTYKGKLSPMDLEIWNNSTYGGAEQVPYFRGYLHGVMARVEV